MIDPGLDERVVLQRDRPRGAPHGRGPVTPAGRVRRLRAGGARLALALPAFLAACAGERAGAAGSAEGPAAVRAEAPVLVSAARAGTVHVEPVIAASPRDPSRLVAAAMVVDRPRSDRWHDSQHVVVYASRDAGRSWQPRPLPGLPDGWMSGDPWLTWTGGDVVYLSCVVSESVLDGRPVAVWVFRSGDGGWTWSGPTPAFPAGTEHDHPVIASGPGPQGEPRVAVFATREGREGEGVDVAILPPEAGEAAALPPFLTETRTANLGSGAVLPDGAGLVFTWFRMPDPPRGLWAVAGDGRGSWTPVRLREGILPVGFPALAVDASEGEYRGRVYAAWVEGADPVDQRELRVLVSGSEDGGRSWSPPVRVHRHDVATQRTLPTVAVNRHGEVAAAWLDWRHLPDRPDCPAVYVAVSRDGGATFEPEVQLDPPACFGTAANGAAARRWRLGGGEYIGMAAGADGTFHVIWPGSRTGRFQAWTAAVRVR